MSSERPQPGPEAIRATVPIPPLSAGAGEGIQLGLDEAPAAVAAGAAPALLVALLQEYAAHEGPIIEMRRQRRGLRPTLLIVCGVGGLVFTGCLVWMVIELVTGLGSARPPRSDPPWMIGMFFGGVAALFVGLNLLMMTLDERKKVAASEAGKADVLRRLLAAFPQLQEAGAKALLSGQAAQAITTRPTRNV